MDSPSAGYLVVRTEVRTSNLAAGPYVAKGSIALVDEVVEPAKGLMVPKTKRIIWYLLDAQGKRWWTWLFRYTVLSVRIDPDLSGSLFDRLFLPLGTIASTQEGVEVTGGEVPEDMSGRVTAGTGPGDVLRDLRFDLL